MMFGSSSIHPTSVNDWGEVNNWDDSIIPQFRQMSEAIHRHGALCLSQISHRGRRGHSWYSGVPLWAPSDTREERHREWPHVMTKREIREVIDAWAAAAVRLRKGGYDGCDVPFYGGHLLENFLSPLTNKRTDEYGGSLENRCRLIGEVLRAVRDAVGPEFIIGVRHSGDHFVPGGMSREELLEVARLVDGLGIADYWMVSGSNPETLKYEAMVTPSLYHPKGLFNDLAALTRSVVKVPVIVAGRVMTVEQAEAALAAGVCDLVGMTRALIADPELPRKTSEGRVDDIRVCVGASEGCIGRLRQGKAIGCVQNPMIGREAELGVIRPAERPKRVVVVGGGAAGLEAARVAAIRGHRVTLFEADRVLGGQILAAAKAPKREDYAKIADWLGRQVEKAGVDVKLGVRATADAVLALKPDAVVVATGATARIPDLPGVDLPHVTTTVEALLGRVTPGRRVVVVDEDGHYAAPTTADLLAGQGLPGDAHLEVLHGGRGHRRGDPLRHLLAPLRSGRGAAAAHRRQGDRARRPPHAAHVLRRRGDHRGRHGRPLLRRQGERRPVPRAGRPRAGAPTGRRRRLPAPHPRRHARRHPRRPRPLMRTDPVAAARRGGSSVSSAPPEG